MHGLGHVLLEQDVGGAQGLVQRGLDQALFAAGALVSTKPATSSLAPG